MPQSKQHIESHVSVMASRCTNVLPCGLPKHNHSHVTPGHDPSPLPHVYIHRQAHRSVFDTVNHYQLSFRTIEWDSFAYRLRDSPEQQSCTSYTGPCETNCMVWSAAPLGRRNRIWMCVIQFHTLNIVARREDDNRCCERRTTLFIRKCKAYTFDWSISVVS